jgi:hypothetical protein
MLPVGAALLSRRFLAVSTCLLAGAGLRVAHAAIAVRLTYEAQKVTDTELKILELGGAAKRLSEQLESTTPWLYLRFSSCFLVLQLYLHLSILPQRSRPSSRNPEKLNKRPREGSSSPRRPCARQRCCTRRMSWTALSLGGLLVGACRILVSRLARTILERSWNRSGISRVRSRSESYRPLGRWCTGCSPCSIPTTQGLDRTSLSGGWAPGCSDDHCDNLEEGCAAFARAMANVVMKDLDLIR